MSLVAIRCEACGGSVVHQAAKPSPACLFCGREQLVHKDAPEGIEPPQLHLPFAIDHAAAQELFQDWRSGRFWAPGELQWAELELKGMFLPAWSWSGRVESHWAALVRAATDSGKRPLSGQDELEVDGLLVPASQTLRRAELDALCPFDGDRVKAFEQGELELPYELGSLTRRAASQAARESLAGLHRARIADEIGARRLSTSHLFSNFEGDPLLLPIWIGTYRVGEKLYRIVVNGQSGTLIGDAPFSWLKLLAALGGFFALAVLGCAVLAAQSGLG